MHGSPARHARAALVAAALVAWSCRTPPSGEKADADGNMPATRETVAAQAAANALPLADAEDFDDARHGLVASEPGLVIRDAKGTVVWDTTSYDFVTGDPPAEVNPSLWRQAKLNGIHGLFEVVPGRVWQVRGYDISNLTLIRGASGWIVVDTLTTAETAAAAMALARKHLGDVRVIAIVITHSHIDHFGGVDGVVSAGARNGVRIIAPRGFVEEATSENVLAGIAMGRRAGYMYGMGLARGPRGHVDTGLGKAPARGSIGFPVPTDLIDHTPQPMEVDGVRFVFQYVPESEAPAELTFYLPDAKAFCGAEIVTHTLHNLYTLRGAKVRDALRWSGYIDDALARFGDAEVVFASHHWPVWGSARVVAYLERQRDAYAFIHDQTLRLANAGATPQEIAERLEMPASLRKDFATRGYYGTLRHDAKAVYQWYFGWYDGNPANLDPLPPTDAGRKYVEAMGGAAEVKRKAREAFDRGEYRWVAMLVNHVVMADGGDGEARELLARAYDQLGYQAESGPWRDEYLSGAWELRHGVVRTTADPAAASGLLAAIPMPRLLDALATRLDGAKADGADTKVNLVFTDVGESYVLTLAHAVLHHAAATPAPDAVATVRLTRDLFLRLVTRQAGLRELVFSDELHVEGSRLKLLSFLLLFGRADPAFPIVTR